ncbi:MAG: ATP-binding protein [Candidatus Kapaibacterium sp.]
MNILLVEDNKADIYLIKELLKESTENNYVITTASDLKEAKQQIYQKKFDAILLDLGLPDSNGAETFESVRAVAGDTPVVIMSGLYDEELAAHSVRQGAQDYIAKSELSPDYIHKSLRYAIERKAFQTEIEQNQKYLEEAQRIGKMGYWEYDVKSGNTYWSDELYHIFGLDPDKEKIDLEKSLKYYDIEESALMQEIINAAIHEGRSFERDFKYVTADGKTVYHHSKIVTFRNSAGKVLKIVGTTQDITDRKLSEKARLKSEEKFRVLFSESLDVIIIVDAATGLIREVNPMAYVQLGYSSKQLLNKPFSILFTKEKESKRDHILEKVKIHGQVFESQDFLRSDRTIVPMDLTAAMIDWGDERAILITLRDVTERKLSEMAIKELNKELEKRVIERTAQLNRAMEDLMAENAARKLTEEKLIQAKDETEKAFRAEKDINDLKSRLISTISHEYRTPLTVISASTEFLEIYFKKNNPEKFRLHINKIYNSIETLLQLVDDVLIAGKVESDQLDIVTGEYDLKDLTCAILEDIITGARGSHVFNFDSKEQIKITTDRKLFRYIMTNLLSNAVKYSEKGSEIRISISKDNNYAVIEVEDKGKGIEESDLKNIFNAFHRGKNIGNISGFGFGLQIVKTCVEKLKGSITVKSKPGEGSLFTVKLPPDYNN